VAKHNYAVVVAEDACTSSAPDMHKFSIEKILPRIARVRDTATILRAFSEARVSDMVRGSRTKAPSPRPEPKTNSNPQIQQMAPTSPH